MPKIGLRLTRTLLRTGVVRTRVCSSIDAIEHCGSLDAFARARDRCAALKEILIPDRIWPEYEDFCSADPDEACHAPVTYLAFKRRHLARLTEPIHLFCMKGGAPHPSLTNQYKNDLVERWMFEGGVKQRYRHAGRFLGRVAELLFALSLPQEGWRIDSLEALGGVTDVAATCPAGHAAVFEVKHLRQDEVLFDLGVKALSGGGTSFDYLPIYSPIDYLLFRVFEASRQLVGYPNRKIVVAVLADYDVYFARALQERWIDWRSRRFFRKERDIEGFLQTQYAAEPNLDHDMKHYISQIDQIWFYDMRDGLMVTRRQIDEVCGSRLE